MATPLQSLLATGTKLWLSSIDPEGVSRCQGWGITGAAFDMHELVKLFKSNHGDELILDALHKGMGEDSVAWHLMDVLAGKAQETFFPVWEKSRGDDGYVSFTPNPLIEDSEVNYPLAERTAMYVAQGQEWSTGHSNRMIQVPATPAGLAALEPLAFAGVPLHVICLYSERQYLTARDAVWRGMQRRSNRATCKSVFTISPGQMDACIDQHFPLCPSRGKAGTSLAQHVWSLNQQFWAAKGLPLKQDILFAPKPAFPSSDSAESSTDALTGPCIQLQSPGTYDAIEKSGKSYVRRLDKPQVSSAIAQLRSNVDWPKLESLLLTESIRSLCELQKSYLNLVTFKCQFFQRFAPKRAKSSS